MAREKLSGYRSVKDEAEKLLETAINRLGLSARAYSRVLNVGRTIADSHLLSRSVQKLGPENVVTRLAASTCISDESQFRWARLSQLKHGVVQKSLRK